MQDKIVIGDTVAGAVVIAAVPDETYGPGRYVITAWRDQPGEYVTWRAYVVPGRQVELWQGHYGMTDRAEAIADMLKRAGYPADMAPADCASHR